MEWKKSISMHNRKRGVQFPPSVSAKLTGLGKFIGFYFSINRKLNPCQGHVDSLSKVCLGVLERRKRKV